MEVIRKENKKLCNSEIISSNSNGFLIEVNHLETELYKNITILKQDSSKYKELSNNARQYISENHSPEKMVQLFNIFIDNL